MTTNTFDVRQALIDAYNRAPVIDADRSETEREYGRHVIADMPQPWSRNHADDTRVRLPLRVAWNGAQGMVLEIGPYDLCEIDVQLLKQAIAVYGNPTRFPAGCQPESTYADVIDLDARRAQEVTGP